MTDTLNPLIGDALACRRGPRLLFRILSFELAAGELVWLRGPNGVGKSSLMRVLAGLLPPAQGQVLIDGEPVLTDRGWWGKQLHYLGHANAAKPGLTVRQQLRFFLRAGGATETDGQSALARVGLSRAMDRPVRVLSAGQTRRLSLARLLVTPRPIWLLDEPATALDSDGTALVAALLQEHRTQGGRALVISHQPVEDAARVLTLG